MSRFSFTISARIMLLILLCAVGSGWVWWQGYQSFYAILYDKNLEEIKLLVKTAHTLIAADMTGRVQRKVPTEISQEQLLRDVQALNADNEGYFWIGDKEGKILAHPDKTLIGDYRTREKEVEIKDAVQRFATIIRNKGEGFVYYEWPWPQKRQKVAFVTSLPEWGWGLGSSVFVEKIEKEINTLFVRLVSTALLVFALFLFFAALLGRSISDPLKKLDRVMSSLAMGNLGVETKLGRRSDEIGSMARTIDVFIRHARRIAQMDAERAEMDKIKNEFVSIVSHELRTPLTAIQGSIGFILGTEKESLPEKVLYLLHIVHNNAERLALLVNDLLDVERSASGEMRLSMKPEKIKSLLLQAIEMNAAFAQKFLVRLSLNVPDSADVEASLDHARFLQIISNLISNAAKFSPPGSGVRLVAERREAVVRISVIDIGLGIPPSFRGRIFQKFSQAADSTARKKGGSGLGLYISKILVERMGGQIGFDSEQGIGSTFWIEFPILSSSVQQKGDF